MRSFLMFGILLLATPAMAAVSITVMDSGLGDGVATISYDDTGEPSRVRLFPLDITVNNNASITDLNSPTVGEPNGVGGYGICGISLFPFISAPDPVCKDPNYSIANMSDLAPDTESALPSDSVALQMRSIYVDGKAPKPSGVLCTVKVDKSCNMSIVANAGRGGMVLEDAGTITPDVTGATGVEIIVATGCQCYGDADGSGNVDVSDLATIVGLLVQYDDDLLPYLIHWPWPPEVDACWDVNADTMIDVGDLAYIVAFLSGYPDTVPPYSPPAGECLPAP